MGNKIGELEAIKEILNGTFTLDMNANDFFYYACAQSVPIESHDVEWMIPIVMRFSASGLNACIAYVANREPIKPWRTPEFEEAILMLKQLKPIVHSDCDNAYQYDKEGPYRVINDD